MVASTGFFNTLEVDKIPGIIDHNLLQMWHIIEGVLSLSVAAFYFEKVLCLYVTKKPPENYPEITAGKL